MAKLTITNTAHEGYRRAGVAFVKGANELDASDFSETQLAQIEQDPRLLLQGANPSADAESEHSLEALVEHLKGLDKDDASLWKQDNTPKASAFPAGVSAEMRDAAWQAFVAEIDAA